jgi:TetR/AcrR family transcriptional repressor of nem operon
LDIAERLVQLRGFNGFSYADVSKELGITTAALHYHFPGKSELGEALIVRYASRFIEALAVIDAKNTPAGAKVRSYADLYLAVLRDERMCLFGMLAAEYQTLPELMRKRVIQFFDDNHAWLSHLLVQGHSKGELHFTGAAEEAAQVIVAALEGAILIARAFDDTTRFQAMADRLLTGLVAPSEVDVRQG